MTATAKDLYEQLWALPDEERQQIRLALNQGKTVVEFHQSDSRSEKPKPWSPSEEEKEKSARATESVLANAGFLKNAPPFDFGNSGIDPREG